MVGRLYKPGAVVTLGGVTITSLADLPGVRKEGPRLVFVVRRSMTSTPDSASLELHGLSAERRKLMSSQWSLTGSAKLSIQTGYGKTMRHLFTGDVRTLAAPERGRSPVTVTADDGGDPITEAPIQVSTIGLTASNMVDLALLAFATRADLPITKHPSTDAVLASAPTSPSIYNTVMVGKAAQLLDEAARIVGARWWVRDSLLFMARRGFPTDNVAVRLPRTHWLTEPHEDRNGLVRLSTFLDPRITPGRQLAVEGRTTPVSVEFLRAESCTYSADQGAAVPWSVDLTARRIGL